MNQFRVGTAAWNLPKSFKDLFPVDGSHLERYSQVLNAVEINTSFYRQHKSSSYVKWAQSVPEGFKFAVKLEKLFTHERKLADPGVELSDRVTGILGLGTNLGCLLIQLPPKLEFDRKVATSFFKTLRQSYNGAIALEPRHKSWGTNPASTLCKAMNLTRVFADPEAFEGANELALESVSQTQFAYLRLHGSPEIYKSDYLETAIVRYAKILVQAGRSAKEVWCIFDNTTFGFAIKNAVELNAALESN